MNRLNCMMECSCRGKVTFSSTCSLGYVSTHNFLYYFSLFVCSYKIYASKELQCDNFAVYSVDIYYFPCRLFCCCVLILLPSILLLSFFRSLLGSLVSLFVRSYVRSFRSFIWCNAPIHIRNHPHIHASIANKVAKRRMYKQSLQAKRTL